MVAPAARLDRLRRRASRAKGSVAKKKSGKTAAAHHTTSGALPKLNCMRATTIVKVRGDKVGVRTTRSSR